MDTHKVLSKGRRFRKRCSCGRGVTINFNGEDLCPICYQEMLKILAMDKKRIAIEAV